MRVKLDPSTIESGRELSGSSVGARWASVEGHHIVETPRQPLVTIVTVFVLDLPPLAALRALEPANLAYYQHQIALKTVLASQSAHFAHFKPLRPPFAGHYEVH